jgi:hypothetical protein
MFCTDIATVVCALKAEDAGEIIKADHEGWTREVGERGGNVTPVEQPSHGNQCKRRNAMCKVWRHSAQTKSETCRTSFGRHASVSTPFRYGILLA